MKKLLALGMTIVALVFMVGCNSSEEKKVFISETEGYNSEITYYYKGDDVTRQTTKNLVSYEYLGATDAEGAEATLEPYASQYRDVKGIDYSIDYEKDPVVEEITITYADIDYEQVKNIDGFTIEGDISQGISMKKSEELMLNQGYTLKE
ncbi:YehR family lipoprotein [Enterococcus saccharolyticus]|uniref:YehR family lipoprotein n=1 Tax=Enterococcus saccharolyticus TaxID=41997 RepID=UPI0039E10931